MSEHQRIRHLDPASSSSVLRYHVAALAATAMLLCGAGCKTTAGANSVEGQAAAPEANETEVVMPSEAVMRDALQAYIDRFNAKDGEGLAALFADDGRIEDPVGGGRATTIRSKLQLAISCSELAKACRS